MAGGNYELGTRFGDLSSLDTAIEHPLVGVWHCPGTTSGATAISTVAVGVEFAKIIATGPGDSSTFFKVRLAKGSSGICDHSCRDHDR